MTRPLPWPWPVAVSIWILAEVLRAASLPAAPAHLRAGLAAITAGPRTWPVYQAWGLGCAPTADAATRQQHTDGCGAAALQAVLRSHGRHVQQSLLWSLTRLPGGGTSAQRLARVGRCFGLDCSVQRLAFDARAARPAAAFRVPLPAVLHLRRGHFVVLRHWSGAGAQLFDPACGGVRVRSQALQRRASGFVVACAAARTAAPMPAPSAAPPQPPTPGGSP